jgi:3-dehydroquinate synthase
MMNRTLTCSPTQTQNVYQIEISDSIFNQSHSLCHFLKGLAPHFAIVTDTGVAPLYGNRLQELLIQFGLTSYLFAFPDGEASKTRHTKECLEDQLLDKKMGRDTCIIALGGGVVTDLAGYLASTYCRGVSLVMIPTTLLGMVDASIGGKNGVNTPHGKNLIGSTYQPKKVWIDPSFLKTLPKEHIKNGVVEMIKHGLIADSLYFELLEKGVADIEVLNNDFLEKVIFDSCSIKSGIVARDPFEKGERHLLNFGHTIGHALEKLSFYALSHGEAVAIGMMVEGYIAVDRGDLKPEVLERIFKVLKSYQLPMKLPRLFTPEEMLQAMIYDKKSMKGLPRFVILKDIGQSGVFDGNFCTSVDERSIINAVNRMNHDLCCH